MPTDLRERGREGVRDGEKQALTGNQTHSLLVYRTILQPTEPHWPGPPENLELKFNSIETELAFNPVKLCFSLDRNFYVNKECSNGNLILI